MAVNVPKAIRYNRSAARRVGWIERIDQIVSVLGFLDRTPGEEDFALALGDWQRSVGNLVPDGMLGPKTWSRLEPSTRFSPGTRTHQPLPSWLQRPDPVIDDNVPVVKPKYVLAAVDGTGSRSWLARKNGRWNSHVLRWYHSMDTSGGAKKYFHGPDSTLGFDTGARAGQVMRFLREALTNHTDARLVIIGHSRGGLIATWCANQLKGIKAVHFLGLYDSVDMTSQLDADVIRNAATCYHAIRHPASGSRISFTPGNIGTQAAAGVRLRKKHFMATHGGIGGDPATESGVIVSDHEDIVNSAVANSWIRGGARSVGVPV